MIDLNTFNVIPIITRHVNNYKNIISLKWFVSMEYEIL